jgi:hypothetical protein
MRKTLAYPFLRRRRQLLWFVATAAVIAAVLFARHCVRSGTRHVDPTVSIEHGQNAAVIAPATPAVLPTLPDDGEVYHTADRLREASAVALAAALRSASAAAEGHTIHTAAQLLNELTSAGLLPPQVIVDRSTMLHSNLSTLMLRYRTEPLGIEILSFPHSRQDGPALMVRIPSLEGDSAGGSVFIAERLGEIAAPAPFARSSECVRQGWIDQPFNLAEVPEVQSQQLRSWLATKRGH